MNDEQHAYWEAYTRTLADLFGLKDWRIQVARSEPNNREAAACCLVWENQKGATISVSNWFLTNYDEVEQRETIAHELFHCHDYRVRKIVEEYVSSGDENEKAKFFLELFRREYEQLCDGASVPLSQFLPLPANRPNPVPSTNKP